MNQVRIPLTLFVVAVLCCVTISRRWMLPDTVDDALLSQVDVSTYDDNGYTPLMLAAASGDDDEVRKKIKEGVPLDAQSRHVDPGSKLVEQNTALNLAVYNGSFDGSYNAAMALIGAGADVRMKNAYGVGPVQMTYKVANLEKRAQLLAQLIRQGGQINTQDNDGFTQAHYAAQNKDYEWIDILRTQFGTLIDFSIQSKNGKSVYKIAEELGYDTVKEKLSQPLVVIGAKDVSERDFMGFTALMLAIIRGDTALIDKQLSAKADVNAKSDDEYKRTPLQIALVHQRADLVPLLLKNGASAKITDAKGRPPLDYVLMLGNPPARNEVLGQLVGAGADINAKDNDGNTLLHLAVEQNAIELLRYLVKHYKEKLKFDIQNNKGKTPEQLAKDLGRQTMLSEKLLVKG